MVLPCLLLLFNDLLKRRVPRSYRRSRVYDVCIYLMAWLYRMIVINCLAPTFDIRSSVPTRVWARTFNAQYAYRDSVSSRQSPTTTTLLFQKSIDKCKTCIITQWSHQSKQLLKDLDHAACTKLQMLSCCEADCLIKMFIFVSSKCWPKNINNLLK